MTDNFPVQHALLFAKNAAEYVLFNDTTSNVYIAEMQYYFAVSGLKHIGFPLEAMCPRVFGGAQ